MRGAYRPGVYYQEPNPDEPEGDPTDIPGDAVAIIPARGGSVRIPRKNVKIFHGAPIMTYTLALAKDSRLFKRIIVSTDDTEIAHVAEQWGVEVAWRPAHLIEPDPGTQAVAADLLVTLAKQSYIPTFACVLYATAPLMRQKDLLRGYVEVAKGRRFAFSVGTQPLADAGQFYWGWNQAFVNGAPLYDPASATIPVPAAHVCDINEPPDWERAEKMFAEIQERGGA